MANNIIQNRVKDELKKQGRTSGWLLERLNKEGVTIEAHSLGPILNNRVRSISLEELRVVAFILKIRNIEKLLVNKYKAS